mgnify:CR=1 FL=1
MQITIKTHSFIDVITNSSSEIYVQANKNTIKGIKSLVDSLLKSVNVNSTAEDLFSFKLENEYDLEEYLQKYSKELSEAEETYLNSQRKKFNVEKWLFENTKYNRSENLQDFLTNYKKEINAQIEKMMEKVSPFDKENWLKRYTDYQENDGSDYGDVNVIVKYKGSDQHGKEAAKIMSSLTSLFNIEESYNG